MNKYYQILLTFSLSIIFIFGCFCPRSNSKKEKQEQLIEAPDSLWMKFAHSMESKNIEYLINNSLDTIQCAECNLDGDPENEFYEAKFVFENHLDKLMHLDSLSNVNYSIYKDDSFMHVSYEIKSINAFEGGYNLIFNFTKIEGDYPKICVSRF